MDSFTPFLIAVPVILIASVLVSKAAGRLGVPGLLIFLLIGILAGSEGPGGFPFYNYAFAQILGVLALVFILHSGGLDTQFETVQAVTASGLVLSTLGVLITALVVGFFSVHYLKFKLLTGMLLGAIVASTDVAAVFTILRSRSVGFHGKIGALLEFESALNDPMAVFLCLGVLQLITQPREISWFHLILMFFQQMILGTVLGFAAGRATRWIFNSFKLEFEGLYPVLSVALVLLTYAVTQALGGSGFLAVYFSGIVLGNENFLHKRSLTLFHDGLAWLMQIAMFFTMGLLVSPKEIWAVAFTGIVFTGFLAFVARPVSVVFCLTPFKFPFKDQLMVSWAGLKGAVPIILAIYPLIAGIDEAKTIFNLVFFVVFVSVLLQGATIPVVSKWLGVSAPFEKKFRYPIEYAPTTSLKSELVEIPIPENSVVIGKSVVEMKLPEGVLIVLIHRNDDVLVPRGGTTIEANDKLLVLAEHKSLDHVRSIVGKLKTA